MFPAEHALRLGVGFVQRLGQAPAPQTLEVILRKENHAFLLAGVGSRSERRCKLQIA